MSHQNLADAFAPAEAHYKAQVMQETWGHLAPKKGKTYTGRIVYTMGVYDGGDINPTIIVCDFPGLPDSPWFYEHLGDFIDSISWEPARDYPKRQGHGEVGCVYEWRDTLKNYDFKGSVRLVFDANKVSP